MSMETNYFFIITDNKHQIRNGAGGDREQTTSAARNGGCSDLGARSAATDAVWLLSHPAAMKGGGG
jgi:hypothetical protein